jgi:hypothetical protein
MKSVPRSTHGLAMVLVGLLAGNSFAAWAQVGVATHAQDMGTAVLKASLPSSLEREKLLAEKFVQVHDIAAFPASCKRGFATLAHTPDFELANPGEPYQATDVIGRGPRLPWRRLLIGGVSSDRCIVFYVIGGFAPYRAAVVLDISKKDPVLVWGGAGGKDPDDLPALISQIAGGAFIQSSGY